MAKNKIHPLWYSEFIPILFFVSSIFAGLSMVILEGSISQKVFTKLISPKLHRSHDDILIGLAKICAGTMYTYLFLKLLVFIHGQHYEHLNTFWGYWFLIELVVFVLIPTRMYTQAVRYNNTSAVKLASVLTLVGIVLNRLNVSVIAFKWYEVERYIPAWQEIAITLAVIFTEILVLRWVVNRMPILNDSPQWAVETDNVKAAPRFLIKEEEEEKWKVHTM
jgi:Ni/Fe-hydrogenase subunit HybB-like protein